MSKLLFSLKLKWQTSSKPQQPQETLKQERVSISYVTFKSCFCSLFPSPSTGQRGTPFTSETPGSINSKKKRQTNTSFCFTGFPSEATGVGIHQRQPTFVMTADARTHRLQLRGKLSAVEGAGRSGRQSLERWSSHRASPWNNHTQQVVHSVQKKVTARKQVRSFKDFGLFTNKSSFVH